MSSYHQDYRNTFNKIDKIKKIWSKSHQIYQMDFNMIHTINTFVHT